MARPSPQTDRVVALVDLLASDPRSSFTLAELVRRLGVNKSSCHSMVTTLRGSGWLVRHPTTLTYRLGPALIPIGRRAAEGFPPVELARPVMAGLAQRYGVHCVALSIERAGRGGERDVGGDRGIVVDQVRDPRSPSSELPMSGISLRPPLGTVVYAWSDEATVERWLRSEPVQSREHHRAVLELTRRRSFSVELSTAPEARLRQLVAQLRAGLIREVEGTGDKAPLASGASIGEMVDRLVADLSEIEAFQDFLPLTLEPAEEYLVSSLSAPVFDHDGQVVLTVSLLGFPDPLAGTQVEATGRELAAAMAEVTRSTGGKQPEP